MYAGTTLHNKSGHIIGVHQRIDRVARRKIKPHLPDDVDFPIIKSILHFEGKNGPDGIKSKSPGRDDPWHFVRPDVPGDTQLYEYITDHATNLTAAFKDNNHERAAFEAAWLAHAIVDGLTPAHHYPLSEEIERLWGRPKEERLTKREKNIIQGISKRDTLHKNWQYWGARGVWTTHYMFEFGFASAIASSSFKEVIITAQQIERVKNEGFIPLYQDIVHDVFSLGMYEEYYKRGWTRHLAQESREVLAPLLIQAVMLAWHDCVNRSALA